MLRAPTEPIVVTITANYYYENATAAQIAAMTNVTDDLKRPQKIKDKKDGKYYYVIVNVSFKQSDNPSESAKKNITKGGVGFGNILKIDPDDASVKGEAGYASNNEITVFQKRQMIHIFH